MTGAQEKAVVRLRKREIGLIVHDAPDGRDIPVSFVRKTEFARSIVNARVTPEGRVVERS